MSRLGTIFGLVRKAPTVLRTLRHLRPVQARAQLAHLVTGVPGPARLDGAEVSLAVTAPRTPFLAAAPHIQVHASSRDGLDLELLGLPLELEPGSVDWETDRHGPLFAYHLHEQAWLRHEGVAPSDRVAIVDDWIGHHARGTGWDPHPISLRLLSWGKLLLSTDALAQDLSSRDRMIRSMADQAETLHRGLEVRLQANHLLSNRIGVVWAGLLFEGEAADRWRAESSALLAEFEAQILRDGGHEERSPMYHSLILENGLDLLNLARASRRTPAGFSDSLESTLRRMLDALALWTGPDGRIALVADSAWEVAAEPASLFDYAERLGLISSAPDAAALCFEDSGYQRMAHGDFVLLASTAAPSPAHQPGHAHADALAFELYAAGRRLVSDTGVFEYRPGPQRDCARGAASHATLVFDDQEQSELWSAHRVGGRVRVAVTDVQPTRIAAEAAGWRRGAPNHRRVFEGDSEGLRIEDRVRAAGHAVVSRLPLAPEWEVSLDGDRAHCRHEDGLEVEIEFEGELAWTVERAPFYPNFHRELDRPVLVGRGVTPLDGTIRFRLR